MSQLVISALLHKKGVLLGEIERLSDELSVAHQTVTHIDGALAAFGYESAKAVRPVRRRAPSMFADGEMSRMIFTLIRERGPQAPTELRDAIIEEKGLNPDDLQARRLIHKKVSRTLSRQKSRGTLVNQDGVWRAA